LIAACSTQQLEPTEFSSFHLILLFLFATAIDVFNILRPICSDSALKPLLSNSTPLLVHLITVIYRIGTQICHQNLNIVSPSQSAFLDVTTILARNAVAATTAAISILTAFEMISELPKHVFHRSIWRYALRLSQDGDPYLRVLLGSNEMMIYRWLLRSTYCEALLSRELFFVRTIKTSQANKCCHIRFRKA